MKYAKITPKKLKGNINIPSSKSLSHRALICAGLSKGISTISNIVVSRDIEATCNAMKSFGAEINRDNNNLIVKGKGNITVKNENIDCYESGSTLRFLIPLGAITNKKIIFKGRGKLIQRPLKPYYDIFDNQKFSYKTFKWNLPLTICGKLRDGEYRIRGDISSQFISGLIFALPLIKGDSKIIITTPLQSKAYVDLTIDMLEKFSVHIENNDYKEFFIKGNQKYKPKDYKVEGDFSQIAFWLVGGLIGNEIICENINSNTLQGDKVIVDILKKMLGNIVSLDNVVKAIPSHTKSTIIDASQCPDLVPVLAVLASVSEGTTKIINGKRLRIKECDRLMAITSELNKLGGNVREKEDGLIIKGKKCLKGGEVSSHNDHRIAMALAIASIKCTERVVINNSECVEKSYPDFWKDFKSLGGDICECNMGK